MFTSSTTMKRSTYLLKLISCILLLSFGTSYLFACRRPVQTNNKVIDYHGANLTTTAFVTDRDALEDTGIPASEIDQLPEPMLELILATLPRDSVYQPTELISRYVYDSKQAPETLVQNYELESIPAAERPSAGVQFQVYVWMSKQHIHVYGDYLWDQEITLRGKDTFMATVAPGYSIVPNSYAASVWHKDKKEDPWSALGMMSFSNVDSQGYSFEREALGKKGLSGEFMGVHYFSLDIDDIGADIEVSLAYAHDWSWGSDLAYTLRSQNLTFGTLPGEQDVLMQMDTFRVVR